MKSPPLFLFFSLIFSLLLLQLQLCIGGQDDSQGDRLLWFLQKQMSSGYASQQPEMEDGYLPSFNITRQHGQREADKILFLPGQPKVVDFHQYSGYVTVDPATERALFYYFAESPGDSSQKPLILWLSGGPGCSSLGIGAMQEVGPFRVNSDGKTLFRNVYSWNQVANLLFLDSAAGVGYSYSNTSSDYEGVTDKSTAHDSYSFLINWLERFPQYKGRDFFIMGGSYAGHYVPQLAEIILAANNRTRFTPIQLKGIAIGNALIDLETGINGRNDYLWTHALISDERHREISYHCGKGIFTEECFRYTDLAMKEIQVVKSNIYSPRCPSSPRPTATATATSEATLFDPCAQLYVISYLNMIEVQKAFHAAKTKWSPCSKRVNESVWQSSPPSVLPAIKRLMAKGIRIWLYSGDVDSIVPVTATKYAIDALKIPVQVQWRAWTTDNSLKEVGGYVVQYKGLTLATIRGGAHGAMSNQPERGLTMVTSFLMGKLPPRIDDDEG